MSHTLMRPLLGLEAWFSTREMLTLRPLGRPWMLAVSALSTSSASAYGLVTLACIDCVYFLILLGAAPCM